MLTSDNPLILEGCSQADAKVGVEVGEGLHFHLDRVCTSATEIKTIRKFKIIPSLISSLLKRRY
jgi:hypothetical protein